MNTSRSVPPNINLQSISFSDQSVLTSASIFRNDLRGTKRLRIDSDASFGGNVKVFGNLDVRGSTTWNGEFNFNGNLPYVDNQTGWGLPEWTFAGSEYNVSLDSLIIKYYDLNTLITTNYATKTELQNATTLNNGLIFAESGTYPLYSGTGYYSKGVTHVASDSYFVIRDLFEHPSLMQYQRGNIQVGKYLRCADLDGTLEWATVTSDIPTISGVTTSHGASSTNSFYVTDSTNGNRGYYFYPNISANSGFNSSMQVNDIAILAGQGNANNGSTSWKMFIGPYNGFQGLRMTSDSISGSITTRGSSVLSGGGSDQFMNMSSARIHCKTLPQKTFLVELPPGGQEYVPEGSLLVLGAQGSNLSSPVFNTTKKFSSTIQQSVLINPVGQQNGWNPIEEYHDIMIFSANTINFDPSQNFPSTIIQNGNKTHFSVCSNYGEALSIRPSNDSEEFPSANNSVSGFIRLSANTGVESIYPNSLTSGLQYTVYETYFNDNVNFFKNNTSYRLGGNGSYTGTTLNTSTLALSTNNYIISTWDDYSIQYLGKFKPDVSGGWYFRLTSDDAAYLWLGLKSYTALSGSNSIASNPGTHAAKTYTSAVQYLTAGVSYDLIIQYGDYISASIFSFEFQGPPTSVASTWRSNLTGFVFSPAINSDIQNIPLNYLMIDREGLTTKVENHKKIKFYGNFNIQNKISSRLNDPSTTQLISSFNVGTSTSLVPSIFFGSINMNNTLYTKDIVTEGVVNLWSEVQLRSTIYMPGISPGVNKLLTCINNVGQCEWRNTLVLPSVPSPYINLLLQSTSENTTAWTNSISLTNVSTNSLTLGNTVRTNIEKSNSSLTLFSPYAISQSINFPLGNTSRLQTYNLQFTNVSVATYSPTDVNYHPLLFRIPINLQQQWRYAEAKQANDEIMKIWVRLYGVQISVLQNGVFLEKFPINYDYTTAIYHDRTTSSDTGFYFNCVSQYTAWRHYYYFGQLNFYYHFRNYTPGDVFTFQVECFGEWYNRGEYLYSVAQLQLHFGAPTATGHWDIDYLTANVFPAAGDDNCSFLQYLQLFYGCSGVGVNDGISNDYTNNGYIYDSNFVSTSRDYDQFMFITPTDYSLSVSELNVFELIAQNSIKSYGIISAQGVSGRRGMGVDTNAFSTQINAPENSKLKWSVNSWGSVFNNWWSGSNIETWVDFTKVHVQTPNFCDYRLKENIHFMDPVLENLCQLQIFKYDRKENGVLKKSENHIGFFAHELQSIFPNFERLVTGIKDEKDEDGKDCFQSVTHEINFLAIKAIQELKYENDLLKNEIYKLNQKLEIILAKIDM